MEIEKNNKLHFLDVLVCNKLNLITSTYRKPKYSSFLTTFLVLHLLNIKMVSKLCWIGVTKLTADG